MKRFSLVLLAVTAYLWSYAATFSGTLPVMYINTENGQSITSKEDYIAATAYLDALGLEGYESVGSVDEPLGLQIRGRGNWTWVGFDKKPYRLKFDSKQAFMGMKKSKHFALMAAADDSDGYLRNTVGYYMSDLAGLPWAPAQRPVEVVLNGEYIGLYFLTETIRVDKDRVNIVEQPDEATDPEAITGGWLVEIDNYNTDPHVTVIEHNTDNYEIWFTYKTPEVLSAAQEEYLTNQMTLINDALYREDLNDNTWENYVDVYSLARYYIVQEVLDDYESFHGSCYLYKDQGQDKWQFGPVWDFGNSFTEGKWRFIYQDRTWHNVWIAQACRHPHFIEVVKEVWKEIYPTLNVQLQAYVDDFATTVSQAAMSDAARWPQYGNGDINNDVARVKSRISRAITWLNGQWGDGEVEPVGSHNAYFINTPGWEEVYVFMWYDNGNQTPLGSWPGTKATLMDNGLWRINFEWPDLPSDNVGIIFGNGGAGVEAGNQTQDFVFVEGGIYNGDGFYSGTPDVAADEAVQITVNGSEVTLCTPEQCTVTIADILGRTRTIALQAGTTTVTLPAGLYLINGRKLSIR
ncbi:MAG: CotH kinase family protein [Muribaculaceae bacterium]